MIRMPEGTHRKLKAWCAQHGYSMQEGLTKIIEAALTRVGTGEAA